MDVQSALKVLAENGSEQTRMVYGRQGVRGAMFGVGYDVLGEIATQIGNDHDVACALWNSGIHEARILATMTADAARLSARDLDLWVRALDNYVITEAFARLVSLSPHAILGADEWINSKDEWISSAGWHVLYAQVVGDGGVPAELTRPEAELPKLLLRIEREIHDAPNRTRYAMNSALIGIGMRSNALERQAIAAATRIGTVAVDHGLTDCKTPDAASYIPKARKYAAARQAGMPKKVAPVAEPAPVEAPSAKAKPALKSAAKSAPKARPSLPTKRGAAKKVPARR
ncbi:MAG TPA: DNA alkylation repair protein [Planctomycetota bacterium]|nr:DNA alkylation repair protein [Planctomycetota bacterium]